jgi:autonomous glycyl radical cofactor GrcA
MFNSNLKDAANGYEPKLRVKIDTDRDLMTKFKVFNEQHDDITQVVTDGLYARKSVVSVVELGSVYFMNRKFGLVWRMAQMQVHEPQRLKGLHIQMPDEPPSP